MTSLAMGETATAVFLRMSYVAASVLFVLVVNRFFFPTSPRSQFRYNLQMLFHMHHMYLRILEDALTNPPDYWRICDAQLQYHMVHGQIKQDLPKTAGTRQEDYLSACTAEVPVKKTAGRISRYTSRSFTAPAACLRRFSSIAA